MSKMVRGCLIGILACLSVLTAASAAGAITVSPSGAYTAASGTTTLSFASNGQVLTCTSSAIGATISSDGNGTSPTGSAVYNSCTNALLGTFTVSQRSAWTVRVLLATVSGGVLVGLDVTVPARGVLISAGSCLFTVSGTVNVGRTYAGLPVAVSPTDRFTVLSSALTVDSVSNCSPLLTVVGLRGTYAGTYTLNRAVTIS